METLEETWESLEKIIQVRYCSPANSVVYYAVHSIHHILHQKSRISGGKNLEYTGFRLI